MGAAGRPAGDDETAEGIARIAGVSVSRNDVVLLLLLAAVAIGLFWAPRAIQAAGWTAIVLLLSFEHRLRQYDQRVSKEREIAEQRIVSLSRSLDIANEAATARLGEVAERQTGISARLEALVAERRRDRTVALNELPMWREAIERPLGARLEEANEQIASVRAGLQHELSAERDERNAKLTVLETDLATEKDERARKLVMLEDELRRTIEADRQAGQEQFARLQSHSVSLDIVSVLRALRPVRTGKNVMTMSESPQEVAHGHSLLMAVLAEEERLAPGALAGKTLIEIGTTRERLPTQGSTEKLAIFAALTDMSFVTVDMDPLNTIEARKILQHLNPAAKAVAMKGEDYLATKQVSLDYVYLDAFDFDHGKHSQLRQSRYKEVLQTDINDEACWKMHEDCAVAIIEKMKEGGIVVLDDTWTDADGQYAGKGKRAVPLLQKNGFEIIAKTRNTVAFRRTGKPQAKQRRSRSNAARESHTPDQTRN